MSTSDRLLPNDAHYRAIVDKRFNKRFSAHPDYVCVAHSTGDVVSALSEAVRENRRVVVTSGGHCLEGFVADPDVRVIIDVSPMKRVYFDADMNAIAIEAGVTVGEALRALFKNWQTLIPLGELPAIGMGGHVVGGAFGFLCRQHGLAADYLYAVEVVTVDADGATRTTIATRENSDPHRELWWAHTGGGGGNFGIVTRYWFRSHDVTSTDPSALLPRAPADIVTLKAEWSWSDFDRGAFRTFVRNYGVWCEQNSGVDSPNASLWTLLELHRKQFGTLVVRGVSTAGSGAERQYDEYIDALSYGSASPRTRDVARMSWLDFALNPLPDMFAMPPDGVSVKVKDAMLKQRLTDAQIDVAYYHLTRSDYDIMGGVLGFATYGGRVNTVARDATASAQRESIIDSACNVGWVAPAEAEKNLSWVRSFYRELFNDTGGVPVPGDRYDGSFINHPDVDHADPTWNASGLPWHTLYYQDNYARLQRVKTQWDPRNIFHHALSIRADV
jgi:aclacinomycin oxidase